MSAMNFWMSGRAIFAAMVTFSSLVMPYSEGPKTVSSGFEILKIDSYYQHIDRMFHA
jgi:hypothetical protein